MNRPNILLITTDQQRFDTIAALGNSHIFTPHLNWLTDGLSHLYAVPGHYYDGETRLYHRLCWK